MFMDAKRDGGRPHPAMGTACEGQVRGEKGAPVPPITQPRTLETSHLAEPDQCRVRGIAEASKPRDSFL